MSTTISCQACGGAIEDRPATAARSPDGRTTWWLHRDLADCLQSPGPRALGDAAAQRVAGRAR